MELFKYTLIDLTHTLSAEIAHWNMGCNFEHEMTIDYSDVEGAVKFRAHQIKMSEGIGTHMDSPAHCFANALTIPEIPLQKLLASCVVIDVSKNIHERFKLSCEDIIEYENNFGQIAPNDFIFIYTGWSRFWTNPEKYRNNLIFPSVSIEAAEFLLQRNICGIGIDTLSPDCIDSGFPVHRLLLNSGKYIVENVANLDKLPAKGAYSLALPMKIGGGTEAPVRLIAFVL